MSRPKSSYWDKLFETLESSGKRMGANQRKISYSKGGKVVLTVRTRVSGCSRTWESDPVQNPVSGAQFRRDVKLARTTVPRSSRPAI